MSALMQVSWFLLVVILPEILVSTHNVSYVMTPDFNFFIANGKTVRSNDAKHIITGNVSNCTCKQTCSAINCMAWSVVVQQDGTNECRLDTEGPTTRTLEDNAAATYFFREDSIPGTYQLHTDNLLYVLLKETQPFYEGKEKCSSIPGHRLVIIKTQSQLEFLDSLGNSLALNLEKKRDRSNSAEFNITWGDGTAYKDTELPTSLLANNNRAGEDIFMLFQSGIVDYFPIYNIYITCQANPLGVEW